MDKLDIRAEMAALDRKDRGFLASLTAEQRRKFSLYLMLRWGSAVEGSAELQEYYVQSVNHYLNRDFFTVNRHPQLQWLMATAASPGLGTPRHVWIAARRGSSNSRVRALAEIYPTAKLQDLEILAQLVTDKDIQQHERDSGQQ